jgi:hypothetical protein
MSTQAPLSPEEEERERWIDRVLLEASIRRMNRKAMDRWALGEIDGGADYHEDPYQNTHTNQYGHIVGGAD